MDELEKLVDKHGLSTVVWFLSCICSEKAEHLRENWQDEKSGKRWDKASKAFDGIYDRIRVQLGL